MYQFQYRTNVDEYVDFIKLMLLVPSLPDFNESDLFNLSLAPHFRLTVVERLHFLIRLAAEFNTWRWQNAWKHQSNWGRKWAPNLNRWDRLRRNQLRWAPQVSFALKNGVLIRWNYRFLVDVGPLQHVVSVVKGKTDLPCDIAAPVADDAASLVLFYKDDGSPSIYT